MEPGVVLTVSRLQHKNTFNICPTLDTSHPLQQEKNKDRVISGLLEKNGDVKYKEVKLTASTSSLITKADEKETMKTQDE